MKLRAQTAGRTFTVAPVPEVDPTFTVTVKKLSDGELAAIYDRHKVVPGAKGTTMAKLGRVTRDIVRASVVVWSGATDGNGADLECTDDAKLMLLDTAVEVDEERTSLWQRIQELVLEAEQADEKN